MAYTIAEVHGKSIVNQMNMNMNVHRKREYVKNALLETKLLSCEENRSGEVFHAQNTTVF